MSRSHFRKYSQKSNSDSINIANAQTATTSSTVTADSASAQSAFQSVMDKWREKEAKILEKLREKEEKARERADRDRERDEDRDDGDDNGGTAAADTLLGNSSRNDLRGGGGDDTLVDSGGVPGWESKDKFKGGEGNDQIHTHWGEDRAKGGAGDDVIYSRSDAGEPMIARLNGAADDPNAPDAPALTPGQPFDKKATNDRLSGGAGADKFVFRIDINAVASILAKHTNDAGEIDWAAVTGENGAGGVPSHIHWVEAFGTDKIKDFNKTAGDKIIITGHTTEVKSVDATKDLNGDGFKDSVITVISQQGANGTHDEDYLGTIIALSDGTDNAVLTAADISVNAGAHHGMFEALEDIDPDWQIPDIANVPDANGQSQNLANVIFGGRGSDTVTGDDNANVLVDRGESSDRRNADTFNAGGGDDKIRTHWGKDTVDGGAGNDLIVSRSDAGEPAIAKPEGASKVYGNQPFAAAETDDTLTGGAGQDTFFFRLDLNAKAAIIARNLHDFSENHDHADNDYYNIDWHDVTNENNAKHDHWLEGIGTDTITDFSSADDTIRIEGHTVNVRTISETAMAEAGRFETILELFSEQGDNGAHDDDILGRIIVQGDKIAAGDIQTDAAVHHGAFGNIDELTFV